MFTKFESSIIVDNLEKNYKGNIQALDGLSFKVDEGSIFGLVGPNGAGKSTAIKIMTTLTKADSGKVIIGKNDVTTQPNRVRKVIGCVAQNSGVFRDGTARENLMLQGELYGLRNSKLKARVAQLLDAFELNDAADRIAATYSGGMLRKLDIALGLIHSPRILFLDEPTTGLDPEARSSLWNIILSMSKKENVTVLLTTHYLEEVDRLADKLAIVNRGRVVVEGAPSILKETLNEDRIHILLDITMNFEADGIKKALSSIRNVLDVETEESAIKLRVTNASSTLVDVLQILSTHQIHVLNASVVPPTIDDVYLKYTNKY